MSEKKTVPETKTWDLGPENEYRFELDPGTSLAIKVIEGRAEIFGFELVEGKVYLFGYECKAAVFTWQGCVIEVTGEPSTEYISDETPMQVYGNLHIALEQKRVRALRQIRGSPVPAQDRASQDPPRVLILGPDDSGKTSLAKILVNYAVRAGQNWTPFLANVDPSEGGWAAPGTISVAPVYGPIPTASPANPLGSAATTAPMSLTANALLPLVYWYAHPDIKKNPLLMDRLIRNLGSNIMDRFDLDAEGRASGLIVDTPSAFASSSSSNENRQKLIKACIDAFKINVIVVVGHEKLLVEMKRTYGSTITVVKVPKSGGVVEVEDAYRRRVHNYQVHTYMYGQVIRPPPGIPDGLFGGEQIHDLVLSPLSTVINFGDLQFYRIGSDTMAPTDVLPIGATRSVSEMQPVPVDPASPGSGLLNMVLALLSPQNPDENERYDEELLDLSVVGFLVVTNIDVAKKRLTVLAPNRGSFSGRVAILGSYEWVE
ncbi:Pre-mRNA cleavage complex II protein Clp1-domain-containing protein [Panaeolus papilionaceus]|nr:Pre-mRNA cleavage complex II protein Clp1-domain-containing protein [Panaeolus papilionaceus]